jgi:hypothetical protein
MAKEIQSKTWRRFHAFPKTTMELLSVLTFFSMAIASLSLQAMRVASIPFSAQGLVMTFFFV